MDTATTSPPITGLPGGAYAAERGPSGKWTVRDVPIFAEHVREDFGSEPIIIDAAWLRAALAMSRVRRDRDGYLAPLHIRHHSCLNGDGDVAAAGFIQPTRVGTMPVEGRPRAVLFADLVAVPDAIYQRIRAGELPYRSVEILNINEPPEISSLALMDHDVPYFRLPLLTIGNETNSLAACKLSLPRKHRPNGRPGAWTICAAATRGPATSILYRQETRPMAETVTAAAEPAPAPVAPPPVTAAEPAPAEDMTATVTAAVTAALAPVLAAIAEIKTLCEAMGSAEEPADAEDVAEEPAAAPGGAPAEQAKASPAAAVQAAKLSALESVQAATAKALDTTILARAAVRDLAGYALADDTEERIRTIAAAGGKPAVDAFVSTVREYGSKEPPRARKGSAPDADAGVPAEVMRYQAVSPAAFEKAKAAAIQYQALEGRTTMTLGKFLEASLYDFAGSRK